MNHAGWLVFLWIMSASKADVALTELKARLALWEKISHIQDRVREIDGAVRVMLRERETVLRRMDRIQARIGLASRRLKAKRATMKRRVARALLESGPMWEGVPSPGEGLFARLSDLEHENRLDDESIRSLKNELSELRSLSRDLLKSVKKLRQEREDSETKVVRLKEEAWRRGRRAEALRRFFDARHFKVLGRINALTRKARIGTLQWTMPVKGWITTRSPRGGMLVSVKSGAVVRAPADGVVLYAGRAQGRGMGLVILHDDDSVTVIMDLASLSTTRGARVRAGDVLGMAPFVPEGTNSRATIYVRHSSM